MEYNTDEIKIIENKIKRGDIKIDQGNPKNIKVINIKQKGNDYDILYTYPGERYKLKRQNTIGKVKIPKKEYKSFLRKDKIKKIKSKL